MRTSLRAKVALAFSAATIVLLIGQALGVKAIAESQEKQLIDSLIVDDMREQMQAYRADTAHIPPLDVRLGAHVSQEGGLKVMLPTALKGIQNGIYEVSIGGREIHLAVTDFEARRIYRIFDYSAYERHFKSVINALMVGTSGISLLTIWLAFWLSGLLVKQIAGLARQVKALRSGQSSAISPGKYDEIEVVELVDTFNAYHYRMAALIEREKEFTGNVSHELRTPLTTIKTSCELLQQDHTIKGKSQQRIKQIVRAAHSMHSLIESLLALAREGQVADSTAVLLTAAIESVVDTFSEALLGKDIEPIVEVDRDVRVTANSAALAIVLTNLVANAMQHTEHGTIRFSYQSHQLIIEDSGGGIPPDALPYVFERFYRAQTRPGNGQGIGLAIVKKICDHNGWSVDIHSELGVGTRAILGIRASG